MLFKMLFRAVLQACLLQAVVNLFGCVALGLSVLSKPLAFPATESLDASIYPGLMEFQRCHFGGYTIFLNLDKVVF